MSFKLLVAVCNAIENNRCVISLKITFYRITLKISILSHIVNRSANCVNYRVNVCVKCLINT